MVLYTITIYLLKLYKWGHDSVYWCFLIFYTLCMYFKCLFRWVPVNKCYTVESKYLGLCFLFLNVDQRVVIAMSVVERRYCQLYCVEELELFVSASCPEVIHLPASWRSCLDTVINYLLRSGEEYISSWDIVWCPLSPGELFTNTSLLHFNISTFASFSLQNLVVRTVGLVNSGLPVVM